MKSKLTTAFLFLFCFFAGGLTFFIYNLRPTSSISSPQKVTINFGDDLSSIAQTLQNHGLIRNRYVFYVYLTVSRQNRQIRAGEFDLDRNQNLSQIVKNLTRGGDFEYTITIKPGMRLEEINKLFPNPIVLPFEIEGYVIPDTYRLSYGFSLEDIIAKIASKSKDNPKTVILASILEREAKSRADKQIVAGILLNRLSRNMPLQVDATVQYARDSLSPPLKYWLPAAKSDLKIDSPLNTYQNVGLPPHPICNPGADSFFAAQNPAPSDYLFYISGADSQMHYAKTLEEHNRNIGEYLR